MCFFLQNLGTLSFFLGTRRPGRVSSSMPSITISVLKGLYTLYRPSSSIPEFGYSGAPKPFGYLFEYAELALLNLLENSSRSLEQLNIIEVRYEKLHLQ
jgi:hypothetical protein